MLLRTRSVLTATLLACAACDSTGLTREQEEAAIANYAEQAQSYYNMGELDRAQGQAEKGLGLDPGNVKLELIRAKVLEKRGRPEDILRAEQILRRIEDEGDYQVRLFLGIALERKGLAFDEAAEAIESGKRLTEAVDPEARVAELRANSQAAWREALTYFERALKEHKDDRDALNGLMRVHGLLGQKAQSLDYAERLLTTTQTDLEFWEKQLLRQEMSADEEARFRNYVRQYSALQVATHVAASVVLHELGRFPDAETHVERALVLDPDRAELYGRRAELRKAQGRYDAAIEDLDQFLRRSSNGFDHPDIRRAWNLRRECEEALRAAPSART